MSEKFSNSIKYECTFKRKRIHWRWPAVYAEPISKTLTRYGDDIGLEEKSFWVINCW